MREPGAGGANAKTFSRSVGGAAFTAPMYKNKGVKL